MKSSAVAAGDQALATQYNNLRQDAQGAATLLATQQSSPNMTLLIQAGSVYFGTTKVDYAGGNTGSFTAPVGNPRIDLVYITSGGTITILQGTAAASPTPPATPSGAIAICHVYLRTGTTAIYDTDQTTNGYILRDIRPIVSIPPTTAMPDVMYNTIQFDYAYTRSHYSDDRNVHFGVDLRTIKVGYPGAQNQTKLITDTWAAADDCYSGVKLGSYLYILARDNSTTPDTWRVYRYDYTNLSAGGTLMTFSGATVLTTTDLVMSMACDGTYLYINYNAGNSANAWVIAKYSISGTTLTYVDSRTCGTANNGFSNGFAVTAAGNIYVQDDSTYYMRKYNNAGTIQYTDPTASLASALASRLFVIEDTIYHMNVSSPTIGLLVKANYV